MGKITKHAEFMDHLHSMITKEATAGTASGKAGKETHYQSLGKELDNHDKNKEGHPEHNPQEFKQEKAKDPSDPTKAGKTAEEAPVVEVAKAAESTEKPEGTKEANAMLPDTAPAKPAKKEAPATMTQHEAKKASDETDSKPNEKLAQLGQQLIDAVNEIQKSATAGTASGKAGKETHYQSLGKELDNHDKNKEGHPEHNPQEFKQEKAKDPSDPTKAGKTASDLELDKEASFELGRQWARAFLTSKTASVDAGVYKEAGRRDFEAIVAQASAELEQEKVAAKPAPAQVKKAAAAPVAPQVDEEALQIKQAEEAGEQAFYELLKQAQAEEQTNQIKVAYEKQVSDALAEKTAAENKAKELADKLAQYEIAAQKRAEEEKLDAKFAEWGARVVDSVITRLKSEPVK